MVLGSCGTIVCCVLGAELTATFGRHRFLPWGYAGGGHGSANAVEIYRRGASAPELRCGKLARFALRRGDVARLITGGGGGYGDPAARDPNLVLADVRNEFISSDVARDTYGVLSAEHRSEQT